MTSRMPSGDSAGSSSANGRIAATGRERACRGVWRGVPAAARLAGAGIRAVGQAREAERTRAVSGWAFEFRVACFGESPIAVRVPRRSGRRRGKHRDGPQQRRSLRAQLWRAAAVAWADMRRGPGHWRSGTRFIEPRLARIEERPSITDSCRPICEALVARFERPATAMRWPQAPPVCVVALQPRQRTALRGGHRRGTTWSADRPIANYAERRAHQPRHADGVFSWRFLANTKWDFVEVELRAAACTGSRPQGFESLNGVVLQPAPV